MASTPRGNLLVPVLSALQRSGRGNSDPNAGTWVGGAYQPLDPNSGDPSALNAQLIKAQRTDFNNRYRPLENEVIEKTSASSQADATAAAASAGKASTISREAFMRDLARTGVSLTGEQQGAITRKSDLSSGLAKINAYNSAYRASDANKTDAMGDLVGIGKGIVGSASQGLSQASSMQAQREAAGDAAKAQSRAQTTSLISTGLGIAAAAFFL